MRAFRIEDALPPCGFFNVGRRMTSVDVLGLRPRLDRVVDRILAPFEPAAVVDGGPLPTHQVGVEPCLACTPAGPAIEGDPLVRGNADLLPDGRDLRVGAHRVVHVAVMLHVVGIRATVAPDVTGDPARGVDVVVAADLADLLVPGPDADQSGVLLVGKDLLRLVDVDDDLRAQRNLDTERRDRRGLADDRPEPVARPDPPAVPAGARAELVDAGVAQDHRRPAGCDLSGPSSRPLLVGVAFGVAAIKDDRGVAGDSERTQSLLELLR